jgi:hypothetical protein
MHETRWWKTLLVAVLSLTLGPGVSALAAPTPEKCQKVIDKAVAKAQKKRLKKLLNCGSKELKKGGSPSGCSTTTTVKLPRGKVKKVCSPEVITLDPPAGLGLNTCAARCDEAGGITNLGDPEQLERCLQCSHDLEVDCLFATVFGVQQNPKCLAD